VLAEEDSGTESSKTATETSMASTSLKVPQPPGASGETRSTFRPLSASSRSGRLSKKIAWKTSAKSGGNIERQRGAPGVQCVQDRPMSAGFGRNGGREPNPAVTVKRRRPARPKSASAATFRGINGQTSALLLWKEEERASPRPQIPLPGEVVATGPIADEQVRDASRVRVSNGHESRRGHTMTLEEVSTHRIQAAVRGWVTRSRLRAEWNLGPDERVSTKYLLFHVVQPNLNILYIPICFVDPLDTFHSWCIRTGIQHRRQKGITWTTYLD
jgi:hypothetical protein